MAFLDSRFKEALEQASCSFCNEDPVLLISGTHTDNKGFCVNISIFGDVDMLLVSFSGILTALIDRCPEERQLQIYSLFAQQLNAGFQELIDSRDAATDT